MIVARLLSEGNKEVCDQAVRFLRRAREVCIGWLFDLRNKIQSSDGEHMEKFRNLTCETAMTCRATFDVDPEHIPLVLNSADDVSDALICAITLHDNQPPKVKDLPPELAVLIGRDERLARKLEPFIVDCIQQDRYSFDSALERIWGQYRPGHIVTTLHGDQSRWIKTTTAAGYNVVGQTVHYNILSGLLLINGKRVGRLPKEISGHDTFARTLKSVSIVMLSWEASH